MIRRVLVDEQMLQRRWKIQDEAATENGLRDLGMLIDAPHPSTTAGERCSRQGCHGRVLFRVEIHGKRAVFCRRCARALVFHARRGRQRSRAAA